MNGFHPDSWSIGRRLVSSVIGFGLVIGGARREGLAGGVVIAGGGTLLLRAITNVPLYKLIGIGARRRAILLKKTISVSAPIEEVFRFWSRPDNFPRFMEHVRDVRILDDRLSHWKVEGPAGLIVEWDSELVHARPNELLAWRTPRGSTVEHAGVIRFERLRGDRTRLDIRMSYTPPGGAIGHVVASLFRSDPKTAMNEDLARFKSLIEQEPLGAPAV
jgi:uncharacterized membrane protein